MRTNEENRERFKRNQNFQLAKEERKRLRIETWKRISARSFELKHALMEYKQKTNGKRERYEFPLYGINAE